MTQAYRVQVTVADRIKAGLALQMVAATTGVPVEVMTARARLSGAACKARWLAMYLAHVTYSWTLDHVGHAFGLNRTTAAAACRWAEDERGRPSLDHLMDRLERNLRDVLEAPRCELSA
ncbi:helix-turn-helix domain-containing protein [uncultured Brevundimonas sp.]|uniref:helix-turn-helix domain-containing protein n=1 Tax=uncultured Brevundimonas sp. TaxID=213418 RepID=UPI0025FB0199|nr:helix-turn-helix domain-containing protein [uncultured Brevundimonas sp.]